MKGTRGRLRGGTRSGGARRESPETSLTLAGVGISKKLSSWAPILAAMPADVFEATIAEAKQATKALGFTTSADQMTRWRLIFEGM